MTRPTTDITVDAYDAPMPRKCFDMMTMHHVLLSGGMDSALALCWATELPFPSTRAWSVDYRQAHSRELEAAEDMARALAVRQETLRTRLTWSDSVSDVVHGRNLFLLNLVASHAIRYGSDCVLVVGANKADLDGFPDCRPEFFEAAEKAISLGLGKSVRIAAPFIDKTKADLIRWARQCETRWSALSQSWSCYVGGAEPCGKCGACVKRAAGFAEAGERDPWKR